MESTSWNKFENNHECICCKFKWIKINQHLHVLFCCNETAKLCHLYRKIFLYSNVYSTWLTAMLHSVLKWFMKKMDLMSSTCMHVLPFLYFCMVKIKCQKTLNKQSYSELYPLKIAVKWNSNNIEFYNMYKTMGMEPMIKMIAHTFLAYALCGKHEPGRAKRRENLIQSLNDIL